MLLNLSSHLILFIKTKRVYGLRLDFLVLLDETDDKKITITTKLAHTL